jgi:hypothetical protein
MIFFGNPVPSPCHYHAIAGGFDNKKLNGPFTVVLRSIMIISGNLVSLPSFHYAMAGRSDDKNPSEPITVILKSKLFFANLVP